jgi:hypothetical protein
LNDLVFWYRLDGLLTVDVSVSSMDINQCDDGPSDSSDQQQIVAHFAGTHKCHETSTVILIETTNDTY